MKDPKGPVKAYKSPEELAKKHKVSLDKIIQQVKKGTKVEGEHTTDKKAAKITALQHVDEIPDYYTKLKKIEKIKEGNLHSWFSKSKSKEGKPGWVNVVTGGTCASDEPGEGVPKCVSSEKRASMTKAERLSAARRKKSKDPGQQQKTGAAKPTYVSTDKPKKSVEEGWSDKYKKSIDCDNPKGFSQRSHCQGRKKKMQEEIILEKDIKGKGSGKKDACYHKVKAKYDVWPSAYASGALVKCRKKGAKNWGNKSEEVSTQQQYEKDTKYCLLCKKNEKRHECSWGPQMWDKYSIAKIHPANESKLYEDHKEIASGKKKDEEGYMARVEFDKIDRAIAMLRKNIKKGDQQIPAWVQSKITRAADFIDTAAEYMSSEEEVSEACWSGYKQVGMKKKGKKLVPNCVPVGSSTTKEEVENDSQELLTFNQFCEIAENFQLNEESPAWQRKEGKNPEGGLNKKGIASYRRENPGSKLSMAVTTPPSKLKPGSKAAKRRKSFCARMGGMKGPMKDEKGRPTRKALSLRKWNC